MTDRRLSVDEIVEHLGISKDTVYAWIAKRSMLAHKAGRLCGLQKLEVDTWVETSGASEASQQVQHDS
ncbi:excisionase family DNA-binding protein [Halopseudomonas sp.]|jgi:excisionase family DNA binding protein|uniref:excisionase family DNA-binding protein n=1 Tax=Halopseudomonas sp. TaxID=2901191 RepID=UPI0039E69553